MFADLETLKTLLTRSRDDAAYARQLLGERLNDLRARFSLNAQGRAELAEIESLLEK